MQSRAQRQELTFLGLGAEESADRHGDALHSRRPLGPSILRRLDITSLEADLAAAVRSSVPLVPRANREQAAVAA
jgi:hypothetical protein